MSDSAFSQFYFFGRNKVQYEVFEWKILKTEHFNVYYYDEMKEIAEIGAKFAEDAYEDLKVKFNHTIGKKIPLIFYSSPIHFQQTNVAPGFIPEGVGGFFEFLKGRVVIPYNGSTSQFQHVIKHELVHVFMMTKVYRINRDHRSINERYPPLWFVEGLAEYWSTEWDTQAEMIMRDAVINDNFVGLQEMFKISGSFLMYKEGQRLMMFISREYGEYKLLKLLENIWRFGNFEDVLEYTLDKEIEKIDKKWKYALKKDYYPLMKEKYPHYIRGNKITEFGFNFSPRVFKEDDKNWVYFIGNRSGYSSFYKLDLSQDKEAREPEIIIEGEQEQVYESFHLLQPSLDVSQKAELAAFVTKSGPADAIHVYSISKEKIVNRYQYEELISIKAPSFSKNGTKLVFNAAGEKGYSDLFVLDLETGKLTRLTNDYYDDKDPVFNEDANRVIFASDRTEGKYEKKYNLFSYDMDSHKISYLTYADADFSMPKFSPDYSELYFNSDYDGNFNIWKLERDNKGNSEGMLQQTEYVTSVFDFTFLNDEKIITSAFEDFSFQFYELNLNQTLDSSQKFVNFDFEVPKSRWAAKYISKEATKERLEYDQKYTLDYAVSQVATDPIYGTRGGALLTLSDMLGNDRYYFLIYNTAEVQSEILENLNVAISRINTKNRTNYGYGVFHYAGRRYDIRESEEYFYERSFGGYLSMVYPFSQFQRIEADVTVANSDKDFIGSVGVRKSLLVSNKISFVHDNSLWGPTGPLDGSRFRALLGFTNDVKYSNVNYYSLILDYRKYLRLGMRSSLAFRGALFYNHGKEARRYFAGGSWDLRGWERWSIRGEKMWLSSLELRYPLIDAIKLKLPIFDITLPAVRGAMFIDAGSAWDEEYRSTLGSIGTGIRVNLFNVIVLRYDIGKRIINDFENFQESLFYQFFFGWDF